MSLCIIFENREDKNVKKFITQSFGEEFEGEWELGNNDDNYELYFYEYDEDSNVMYLNKGDNNYPYFDRLYKEIEEVFSGFKYSISVSKKN